jgi:hypothetical protein
MDNLLIGVDSIEEATILRDDLINILAQGGFELCKWASKRVAVLPHSARINYIGYKIPMLDFALKYVKNPKLLNFFLL